MTREKLIDAEERKLLDSLRYTAGLAVVTVLVAESVITKQRTLFVYGPNSTRIASIRLSHSAFRGLAQGIPYTEKELDL